jgi:hypothetical protein
MLIMIVIELLIDRTIVRMRIIETSMIWMAIEFEMFVMMM